MAEKAWVSARVQVPVEECMSAVEIALRPHAGFPDEDMVRRLDELHAKVMKSWIPKEERCAGCDGGGEQSGGSHSWSCTSCGGKGRR